MFLATDSNPEITYESYQFMRFTHNPKQNHGTVVKCIMCYLKGRKNRGMSLNFTKSLPIDCYVNENFTGFWNQADDKNPILVKSWWGYIIMPQSTVYEDNQACSKCVSMPNMPSHTYHCLWIEVEEFKIKVIKNSWWWTNLIE